MLSSFHKSRNAYVPSLPKILNHPMSHIQKKEVGDLVEVKKEVAKLFPKSKNNKAIQFVEGQSSIDSSKPLKVGVILSGGPAPGGHNVIAGIFDAIKKFNLDSTLIGFLGGPDGLLNNQFKPITEELLSVYRNTGGFDIIGSGRGKIQKEEEFVKAKEVALSHKLDALVIIGGDDSNTNAAFLAEYFAQNDCPTCVIGVPKTIDGDLKNQYIPTSFGFDTATKIYSEIISNIARDALSSRKYWHFIKIMGRTASHVALECALNTQIDLTFLSEEVKEKQYSLVDLTEQICSVVIKKAQRGENFGVILLPEGVIEFVPELKKLIDEINGLLAHYQETLDKLHTTKEKKDFIGKLLSHENKETFEYLGKDMQDELILARDPHGNVQVSLIESEKFFIHLVKKTLEEKKEKGLFKNSFAPQAHFLGYEGRAGCPSLFDCNYCYALGFTASLLILNHCNGYMSIVNNLTAPFEDWHCEGQPITHMMDMELRLGEQKCVITKSLVDLKGKSFQYFAEHRKEWQEKTSYLFAPPIQFEGEESRSITKTLKFDLS